MRNWSIAQRNPFLAVVILHHHTFNRGYGEQRKNLSETPKEERRWILLYGMDNPEARGLTVLLTLADVYQRSTSRNRPEKPGQDPIEKTERKLREVVVNVSSSGFLDEETKEAELGRYNLVVDYLLTDLQSSGDI